MAELSPRLLKIRMIARPMVVVCAFLGAMPIAFGADADAVIATDLCPRVHDPRTGYNPPGPHL